MVKRLIRTGNRFALVLDKPLLVVTPVRDHARERKLKKALEEMDREYGGVFKRLAE
ncbi:MAG TPA: hypothetical protein VGA10_03775 [Thermoanaerobaculia bacterium]